MGFSKSIETYVELERISVTYRSYINIIDKISGKKLELEFLRTTICLHGRFHD